MLDRRLEAELTKTIKTFAITVATSWPGMQIQYVGDKLFAGIDVDGAGPITFYADDIDGETTVDPDIGFTTVPTALGIIDLSAPAAAINTFAKLRNHINGQANWRCFLVGVLPTQSTDNKLDELAEADSHAVRSAAGLTLLCDEAVVALDQGFVISNQAFISRPGNGRRSNRAGWLTNENCINALNFLSVQITATGNTNIEIYWVDDNDDTVQLIWEQTTATTVLEEHGDDPALPWIIAPIGKTLLVYFDNAAAATAVNVHATGVTENIVGDRVANNGAYLGA